MSNTPLQNDALGRYGMIGRSAGMLKVYEAIDMISYTPMNVLLAGPTGTGKELAARAIFENSNYRNAFVAGTARRFLTAWPRASCSATSAGLSRQR